MIVRMLNAAVCVAGAVFLAIVPAGAVEEAGVNAVSFTCPDASPEALTANFFKDEEDRVEVTHGEDVYAATAAISASGARYTGSNGFQFWTKGNEATVTLPGGKTFTCTEA